MAAAAAAATLSGQAHISNPRKLTIKLYLTITMALAVLSFALPAHAGDAAFIRMDCSPASGHFRINHVAVDAGDVQGDRAGPADDNRIMHSWRQRGLYDVDALRYDCRLPGVRYQVRVRRDPYKQDGQCAQAPRINFTLLRNGAPVLQDIPFGDDCYVVFALRSLEITETANHTGMRLCYGLYGDPDLCMEVGAKYKAIGTRHGKRKTMRPPPIDKNIFEELTAPSR